MTTIDVHAHLALVDSLAEMRRIHPGGTPRLVDRDDGRYFEYPTGVVNGPLPPGMVDLHRRLGDMDAQGVDVQVVSVRPQVFGYDVDLDVAKRLASVQNDGLVETVSHHPDRLQAMISLPLQDSAGAVAEIGRWADERSVRGVLIDSNVAGRNLDDERLLPVWSALADADLPVLVHPYQGDVAGMERMRRYYLFNLIGNPMDTTIALASVVFGGILDRFPTLRWCFVHGGGYAPFQIGRWDHGWSVRREPKAHLSEPPSTRLSRLFYDSLTHGAPALRLLAEHVGRTQIMLGSDYPFDMGDPRPVDTIRHLGLSDPDEGLILGDNARRFLRPA